mgnify:CR=1 FL=1
MLREYSLKAFDETLGIYEKFHELEVKKYELTYFFQNPDEAEERLKNLLQLREGIFKSNLTEEQKRIYVEKVESQISFISLIVERRYKKEELIGVAAQMSGIDVSIYGFGINIPFFCIYDIISTSNCSVNHLFSLKS